MEATSETPSAADRAYFTTQKEAVLRPRTVAATSAAIERSKLLPSTPPRAIRHSVASHLERRSAWARASGSPGLLDSRERVRRLSDRTGQYPVLLHNRPTDDSCSVLRWTALFSRNVHPEDAGRSGPWFRILVALGRVHSGSRPARVQGFKLRAICVY